MSIWNRFLDSRLCEFLFVNPIGFGLLILTVGSIYAIIIYSMGA